MWPHLLALACTLFLLPAQALAGAKEKLAALAPSGLVLVVDEKGNELVAPNANKPFVPASGLVERERQRERQRDRRARFRCPESKPRGPWRRPNRGLLHPRQGRREGDRRPPQGWAIKCGGKERERERHAGSSARCSARGRRFPRYWGSTGEKFLEPSPAARDRLEDAPAILDLHRTQVWLTPSGTIRTTALGRLSGPGQVDRIIRGHRGLGAPCLLKGRLAKQPTNNTLGNCKLLK